MTMMTMMTMTGSSLIELGRTTRAIALVGTLVLSGCAGEESGINMPPPPPTRTQDVIETLHGVGVPDPYRWLEDQEADETRAWIDAQNAYTDSLLQQLPERGNLREIAARVLERDVIGLPTEWGGRYFFTKRRADQQLSVVYVRDAVDGQDQVLINPHPMSHDHTTSVRLEDIAQDGTLAVYAVQEGGVDRSPST